MRVDKRADTALMQIRGVAGLQNPQFFAPSGYVSESFLNGHTSRLQNEVLHGRAKRCLVHRVINDASRNLTNKMTPNFHGCFLCTGMHTPVRACAIPLKTARTLSILNVD